MSTLRRSTLHRVLYRPNLILGGERELVMFTALLTGGLAASSQNLVATLVSLLVWIVCLWFLRRMAKADPFMSQVYIRQLKYGLYLPARSGALLCRR